MNNWDGVEKRNDERHIQRMCVDAALKALERYGKPECDSCIKTRIDAEDVEMLLEYFSVVRAHVTTDDLKNHLSALKTMVKFFNWIENRIDEILKGAVVAVGISIVVAFLGWLIIAFRTYPLK